MDHVAYEVMTQVESISGNKIEWDSFEVEHLDVDLQKYSAEIHDLLCQAVTAEPLKVIRTVEDMEGLEAWHKLVRQYSPKSMVRAVRLVGQVTHPPKAESELDTTNRPLPCLIIPSTVTSATAMRAPKWSPLHLRPSALEHQPVRG